MVQRISGRYISTWDSFMGTVKMFFLAFIISFVVIFVATGADRWSFWGALGLGFFIAIIITVIMSLLTKTKTSSD
jgi:hypothetical protein